MSLSNAPGWGSLWSTPAMPQEAFDAKQATREMRKAAKHMSAEE